VNPQELGGTGLVVACRFEGVAGRAKGKKLFFIEAKLGFQEGYLL
jgi:hypothetical protein